MTQLQSHCRLNQLNHNPTDYKNVLHYTLIKIKHGTQIIITLHVHIDLIITPASISLNQKSQEECFGVQSKFDSDLQDELYNLTIAISDTLENKSVIVSRNRHILISVEDIHGNCSNC